MTIALEGKPGRMWDYLPPPPTREIPRYRYTNVLVYQGTKAFMGSVVSHLSLEDWAAMKGYQVDELNKVYTQSARQNERTTLYLEDKLSFILGWMIYIIELITP